MSKTYSAGIVTAYGAAKRAGYQGTYEDFCRQQAGYAENAAAVEQAKTTAVNAASTATTKAGEATTAATAAQTAKTQTEQAASQALTDISTARSGAISAVQTEGQTQTANARAQAQAAAQSATTASTKASEASAFATSAGQSAASAAASATSAAQSASDAHDVLDSIPEDYSELSADVDKLKADLADVANHPVKSAEQLISDKRTVDKVPYKYRASQSGKSDRAYDMIVGGTVCFKQLFQNGDFSNGANGWEINSTSYGTFTTNDGVCTLTIVSAPSKSAYVSRRTVLQGGHVFLYLADIKPSANTTCRFMYTPIVDITVSKSLTANLWSAFTSVVKIKSDVVNQTAAFLYINLNAELKEGDTVLLKNIMLFDLTAMFGPAIADHIYALEQVTAGDGVALFRQMFPNDYYPYNAGSLISVDELSAHVMRDADDNIIGSYPLDSTLTLRGVPVLKDGKIEFDGDTYKAGGTVTRRYEYLVLDETRDWQLQSINDYGIANFKTGIEIYSNPAKALCNRFERQTTSIRLTTDEGFLLAETNYLYIRIKSSTTSTVEEFKTWLSNNRTEFVYELATPTTEEATPYTSPQVVSPYGTEEYISETICPVGHVTEYPDNLRAKLDGLPWDLSMIAPVETAYTATRNYTTGQLLIVDNTLYKVTANIANGGTITPNSNVTATTLSEVISALA